MSQDTYDWHFFAINSQFGAVKYKFYNFDNRIHAIFCKHVQPQLYPLVCCRPSHSFPLMLTLSIKKNIIQFN